ncbi:unnamed protein product [Gordionus sp. m RMFG-2023]
MESHFDLGLNDSQMLGDESTNMFGSVNTNMEMVGDESTNMFGSVNTNMEMVGDESTNMFGSVNTNMEMVGDESTNMFGSVNTNMEMVGDESTNMSGSVNTNMEMLDFGASFNSFEELKTAISNYERKTKGKGLRNSKSLRQNCTSNFVVKLIKRGTNQLVVTRFHDTHNHELDSNLFKRSLLDNLSLLNSIKMPPLKMGYLKQMEIKKGKTCGNVKITSHISNGISEPDHNSGKENEMNKNPLTIDVIQNSGKENKMNKNPLTSLPKNNRIAVSELQPVFMLFKTLV